MPENEYCDQCMHRLGRSPAAALRLDTPVGASAARATVVAAKPRTETLFGKYELVRKIGEGGMGVVYEAKDTTIEKKVAIKKMRPEIALDPRSRRDFLREAQAVAKLHHPYIVDIYQTFEEGDDVYLVFEFMEGQTLEGELVRRVKLAEAACATLGVWVCMALEYAHGQGVIHRDLKPSNIMLTTQGFVKVMDFGIARQAKDTMTRFTGLVTSGTCAYMAPEQELGRFDARSDIYSLGVTLYELLTGSLPFPGPNFLAQKERAAYDKAPGALGEVIDRCLQADRDRRFAGAAQLRAELERIKG